MPRKKNPQMQMLTTHGRVPRKRGQIAAVSTSAPSKPRSKTKNKVSRKREQLLGVSTLAPNSVVDDHPTRVSNDQSLSVSTTESLQDSIDAIKEHFRYAMFARKGADQDREFAKRVCPHEPRLDT